MLIISPNMSVRQISSVFVVFRTHPDTRADEHRPRAARTLANWHFASTRCPKFEAGIGRDTGETV